MVLDRSDITIESSKSILSFETGGSEINPLWDRYLMIEGKKAYHIGNICGTCSFFFERMEGANQSVNPEKVIDAINSGVANLETDFLSTLQEIFPVGNYIVVLSEISPKLVLPGGENDYFSKEQIDLWGIDPFYGLPHSPKTEYYRLRTSKIGKDQGVFEMLVPMFPSNWLQEERLTEYKEALHRGEKPTAISLSILDVKQPADWSDNVETNMHYCLAHYLIDGHHKTYAAATEGLPITLISFIAIGEGVSSEEEIEKVIQKI